MGTERPRWVRTITSHEAGHTVTEVVVAAIVLSILVLLLMPALGNYDTNATVRTEAMQAVNDFREAQTLAMDENVPIQIMLYPSDLGTATQRWAIYRDPPGSGTSLVFQHSIPSQLNVVSGCYMSFFYPPGNFKLNPGCGNPASVELICFDSGTPANPFAVKVTVVLATGDVIAQQKVGACP